MEKLKSILFLIIVLALMALLGYWAVSSMQSGTEYTKNQAIKELREENKNLKKEVESLTKELSSFKETEEVPVIDSKEELEVQKEDPKDEIQKTSYKYQSLINELQKLIDDNVSMKLKSKGTRVGTVQDFLNIYNKTSNRVDNDYGASTKSRVIAFQKAEGLTADGEAGPSTFVKMIDWLKKQN